MLAAPRSDGRTGALEVEAAREFIREEGKIERTAVREELGGKSSGLGGPLRGVITAAGLCGEKRGSAQPAMAQRVELGTADFEARAGTLGIASPGVEVGKNGGDEGGGQAVAELLFIIATMTARGREGSAHPLWDARLRPSATLRAAAGRPRAESVQDLPVQFCTNPDRQDEYCCRLLLSA